MPSPGRPWLFVEVQTDEGVTGLGECSNYLGNPHLVRGLEALKPLVVGTPTSRIEEVWQRLFHAYPEVNPRGYISQLMSAIDIALWDIRGKVLGLPIFELLGGPVRDRVPLYTHLPGTAESLEDLREMTAQMRAAGYEAVKTDPFPAQRDPRAEFKGASFVERLTPRALREATTLMENLREAAGADAELLVDAHGRFDVASAIAGARALEHVGLTWYEEPTHVESNEALRQVRENTSVPLCIGERHFTRWDYLPVLEGRLVDYLMPDVGWGGGISELRRVAAQAEPYFIPVGPHDGLGPIAFVATFHVCMATPNLYRQECVHGWFRTYGELVTPMLEIRDGAAHPSDRPGLGIELVGEGVERYRVDPDDPRVLPEWWTGAT